MDRDRGGLRRLHDRQRDNGWLHAQAKGRFCVVAMTVTNIGREDRRFADGLQTAYGRNGER